MINKLRRCPLCGGEAEVLGGTVRLSPDLSGQEDYVVAVDPVCIVCGDCGLSTRSFSEDNVLDLETILREWPSVTKAISLWNDRVHSDEID